MKKHIYWIALALMFLNGCSKEESFELPTDPSSGSLQDDVTGDCLPKTVSGVYSAGQALVPANNSISVEVNVVKTGTYTVFTDTVNGYYFRATGSFTSLGANTVILRGNGTPFAAGTNNFVVTFDSTVCDIQVTVVTPGAGTLAGNPNACAPITVNGSYSPGVPLSAANNATIQVNVTTAGAFNFTTDTVAGIWFNFAGTLAIGPQNVTLTPNGSIPAATALGDKTFTVKLGTSRCTFVVPVVAAGAATLGGAPNACAPITVNGVYSNGSPLTPGHNVVVQVTVATAGAVNITTNTQAGFSFAFSGTLAAGTQNVTLQAVGGPPTGGSGNLNFTVTLGASTCTFSVPISGNAQFTINCPQSRANGTYQVGQNLTAANTILVDITVAVQGNYSIDVTVNGMRFTGSGFLTIAMSSLVLNGVTTTAPLAAGVHNLDVNGCLIPITVNPVGGAAVYAVNCTTAVPSGLYEQGTQLNGSNTVDIDVNVTTIGTYNITSVANNGMTFSSGPGTFSTTGITTVTLTGSGTPQNAGNFNIQVGPPTCTFPITVDPPLAVYHWQFTVTNAPQTIYRGENDFVNLGSNPPIPGYSLGIEGSNAIGSDYFLIVLVDANSSIVAGETYSTSAIAGNAAGFEYDQPAPLTDVYVADPSQTGVSMTFTITTHNVATKTITGTFAGTAKNTAGQIINITNGTFTATYP